MARASLCCLPKPRSAAACGPPPRAEIGEPWARKTDGLCMDNKKKTEVRIQKTECGGASIADGVFHGRSALVFCLLSSVFCLLSSSLLPFFCDHDRDLHRDILVEPDRDLVLAELFDGLIELDLAAVAGIVLRGECIAGVLVGHRDPQIIFFAALLRDDHRFWA